jgi:hypothetical protein
MKNEDAKKQKRFFLLKRIKTNIFVPQLLKEWRKTNLFILKLSKERRPKVIVPQPSKERRKTNEFVPQQSKGRRKTNLIVSKLSKEHSQIKVYVPQLWGCTCTSHLVKTFPCFSDKQEQEQEQERDQEDKNNTLIVTQNKYSLFRMSSRISWHHVFKHLHHNSTLFLFLSHSLSLCIFEHDLSPNLSTQNLYKLSRQHL